MKTGAKVFLTMAAVGVAVAIIWQKSILTELRTENQKLQSEIRNNESGAAGRLGAGKPESFETELQKLREANRDLPALRNEIGQLRRQKKELDGVRAENEKLALALKSKTPLSPPKLVLPKASWINAGQGSPEAAVQTFFWAMRENNVPMMRQCFTPAVAAKIGAQSDEDLRRGFSGMMAAGDSIEVAARKSISDDEILLGVRFGGREVALPLKKVGSEWKVDGF